MNAAALTWAPALVLSLGVAATFGGVQQQNSMPLQAPLESTVPAAIDGFRSSDLPIPEDEQRVAGMDEYVMRIYSPDGTLESPDAFSVYVGYYERQSQGHTIHSPRNCLPGGGWEPLTSSREKIATSLGTVPVNRYLIGNKDARAVVLYWYQGRGRVEASEYKVKWDLLRDQALHGRSDEALVRVIVPVTTTDDEAYERAVQIAQTLAPAVDRALPS